VRCASTDSAPPCSDHQHGAGIVEGPPDRLAIRVVRCADLGLGQIRGAGRIANDQAHWYPASRQVPGDQADAPVDPVMVITPTPGDTRARPRLAVN
jgi:hypothetical protein